MVKVRSFGRIFAITFQYARDKSRSLALPDIQKVTFGSVINRRGVGGARLSRAISFFFIFVCFFLPLHQLVCRSSRDMRSL